MEASSLNCCTVLLAWVMLLVLAVLLDIFNCCFYLKAGENFLKGQQQSSLCCLNIFNALCYLRGKGCMFPVNNTSEILKYPLAVSGSLGV